MRACAARCERLLMPSNNVAPQSNYLDARAAAAGRADKRARLIDSKDHFSQHLLPHIESHMNTVNDRHQDSKNPSPQGNACCSGTQCGCNSSAAAIPATSVEADQLRQQVRAGYSKIAEVGSWSAAQAAAAKPAASAAPVAGSCCGGSAAKTALPAGGGCCGPATFTPEQLVAAIGYSAGELASTPAESNMGLSCGNPTAIASLRAGEVVLDLGAGGGFDCFVAGPKVGATGKVIGVDMTPDMVSKARRNMAAYTRQTGLTNVEFRLGEIESLPVADGSVDVVISNCVLNLSPDKPRVWKEIARVLAPGGRVAVSDLALLRPLPPAVLHDVEALVGCVAGAVLVEESRAQAVAAGLTDIVLTPKPEYIAAMTDWQDPLYLKIVAALPAGTTPSDFITSLDMTARKAR
jgi:SAM-dependent methyltransferase